MLRKDLMRLYRLLPDANAVPDEVKRAEYYRQLIIDAEEKYHQAEKQMLQRLRKDWSERELRKAGFVKTSRDGGHNHVSGS